MILREFRTYLICIGCVCCNHRITHWHFKAQVDSFCQRLFSATFLDSEIDHFSCFEQLFLPDSSSAVRFPNLSVLCFLQAAFFPMMVKLWMISLMFSSVSVFTYRSNLQPRAIMHHTRRMWEIGWKAIRSWLKLMGVKWIERIVKSWKPFFPSVEWRRVRLKKRQMWLSWTLARFESMQNRGYWSLWCIERIRFGIAWSSSETLTKSTRKRLYYRTWGLIE